MKHTNLREMFGSLKERAEGNRGTGPTTSSRQNPGFVGVLAEFHIQFDLSW